jgi:hypothetical protein
MYTNVDASFFRPKRLCSHLAPCGGRALPATLLPHIREAGVRTFLSVAKLRSDCLNWYATTMPQKIICANSAQARSSRFYLRTTKLNLIRRGKLDLCAKMPSFFCSKACFSFDHIFYGLRWIVDIRIRARENITVYRNYCSII